MTKYHEWKRRLWGGDYPIENGPPYRDPGTGAPILPGGIQGGPYQGVDDNGPQSGNPVVLTFTGPATGDLNVGVLILDETASAPAGGRWVGASVSIQSGATADQIGQAIADDFNARSWAGWVGATNAAGVVTFTPVAAGTAEGWVVYAPYSGTTAFSLPPRTPTPTPVPGDGVHGPFTTRGKKYWIQREGDEFYVWFDVVPDPDSAPDTRFEVGAYVADPTHAEYAPAIRRKAQNYGWGG